MSSFGPVLRSSMVVIIGMVLVFMKPLCHAFAGNFAASLTFSQEIASPGILMPSFMWPIEILLTGKHCIEHNVYECVWLCVCVCILCAPL